MALETKDILDALDLGDITTKEQLIEMHNKKFVPLSNAHENEEVRGKVIGKFNGSVTTLIKKNFDLSPEEIKDKKLEDVIELASSKTKTKLFEFETNSKKNKDETVLDLENKLEKFKKDALDYKGAAEVVSKALQEKEALFEKEKKGWKVKSLFENIQKDFEKELVSDIEPLKRKGFEADIAEKYIFEVDETGEALAVYNAADKTRVQDPKKLGSFLSPKELLITEASKHKLVKMATGSTTKIITELNTKQPVIATIRKSNINPDDLPPLVRKRMGL